MAFDNYLIWDLNEVTKRKTVRLSSIDVVLTELNDVHVQQILYRSCEHATESTLSDASKNLHLWKCVGVIINPYIFNLKNIFIQDEHKDLVEKLSQPCTHGTFIHY
jgi:hypothetical protein